MATEQQITKRAGELRAEVLWKVSNLAEGRASLEEFPELTIDELGEILSLTIKEDDTPKKLLFLACVANYIGDNQVNVALNGPSSSGKTFISRELLRFFPKEDVFTIGKISPQAFYHSHSKSIDDADDQTLVVDLERKIFFFTDQPNTDLLANIRPLLSKDSKEVKAMITDRNKRGSNRTKTVVLRGFPTIIFCSANLNMDEQERTRLLLLSPELSQKKIDLAVAEALKRASNRSQASSDIDRDERVVQLKERIVAIRGLQLTDVVIEHLVFEKEFRKRYSKPLPRHSRDIERISYLIKGLAALNFQQRECEGSRLFATREDIEGVFSLWEKISVSQDAGIQPYVADFFEEYILGAYKQKYETLEAVEEVFDVQAEGSKSRGVTFKEIGRFYYQKQKQPLNIKYLRRQILEGLEQADWISIEVNPENRREMLVVLERPEEGSK